MTVLAACYDPDRNRILVGHDTGHTLNGLIVYSEDKTVRSADGSTLLAVAGNSRWADVVRESGVLDADGSAWDLCLRIRTAIRDDGAVADSADDAWLWRTNFSGILCRAGELFLLDGAVSPLLIAETMTYGTPTDIQPVLGPGFCATGAGEDFTRGAWHALMGVEDYAYRGKLMEAIEAAIYWSAYCHGRAVIYEVPAEST